jgi:ABC-type multidrug transport system fused ATPase/permease subunit
MAGTVTEDDQLIYVGIGRDRHLIAEAFHPTFIRHRGNTDSSEIETIAAKVLVRLVNSSTADPRGTLQVNDEYMVHYQRAVLYTFMVVAKPAVPQARAFVFLEAVRADWGSSRVGGDNDDDPPADVVTDSLRRALVYYSNPAAVKLDALKTKTQEVARQVKQNIDALAGRDEELQLLNHRAEELEDSSFAANRHARKLHWQVWVRGQWLSLVIVFLILFFIFVACAIGAGIIYFVSFFLFLFFFLFFILIEKKTYIYIYIYM